MDRRSFILAWPRRSDAIQVSPEELKEEVEREFERVVNASPIIFLYHVGLLDQFNEPGVTVLDPDVVIDELGGLRPDDPAIAAVRVSPWIQVVATPPIPESLRSFRLDRGETAVLAVALTPCPGETEVVLDDLAARRCATTLGFKVLGSLSFLLVGGRGAHTGGPSTPGRATPAWHASLGGSDPSGPRPCRRRPADSGFRLAVRPDPPPKRSAPEPACRPEPTAS